MAKLISESGCEKRMGKNYWFRSLDPVSGFAGADAIRTLQIEIRYPRTYRQK